MARRGGSNGFADAVRTPLADDTGASVLTRGILMQDPIPKDSGKRKRRLKQGELQHLIEREETWLLSQLDDDLDGRIFKKIKAFLKEFKKMADRIPLETPLRSEEDLDDWISRFRDLCLQTTRGLSSAPRAKNAINDLREDLIQYLAAHYALRAQAVLADITEDGDDDYDGDEADEPLLPLTGPSPDEIPEALESQSQKQPEPLRPREVLAHLRGLIFGRLNDF